MMFKRPKADITDSQLSPEDQALLSLADAFRRERLANKRRRMVLILLFFGLFVFSMAVQLGVKKGWLESNKATGKGDHIAGIVHIDGVIGEHPGEDTRLLIEAIRKAFESKQTDRVVLLINSPGGSPYTSERIIRAIEQLREENDKPLDAVIETIGASAAYMIAVHADRIFAGDYSMVGSIGAKLATWDLHQAAENHHARQLVFSSGELKNMLNPFTEPTPQGMKKADTMVRQAASYFSEDVFRQRKDRLQVTIDRLTTGEVWMGREALSLGLIDKIGTVEDLLEETNSKRLTFKKDIPLMDQLLKGVADQFRLTLSSWFDARWRLQ